MKIICTEYEQEHIIEALRQYDTCPFELEFGYQYCLGKPLGMYPCEQCLKEHIEWEIK